MTDSRRSSRETNTTEGQIKRDLSLPRESQRSGSIRREPHANNEIRHKRPCVVGLRIYRESTGLCRPVKSSLHQISRIKRRINIVSSSRAHALSHRRSIRSSNLVIKISRIRDSIPVPSIDNLSTLSSRECRRCRNLEIGSHLQTNTVDLKLVKHRRKRRKLRSTSYDRSHVKNVDRSVSTGSNLNGDRNRILQRETRKIALCTGSRKLAG